MLRDIEDEGGKELVLQLCDISGRIASQVPTTSLGYLAAALQYPRTNSMVPGVRNASRKMAVHYAACGDTALTGDIQNGTSQPTTVGWLALVIAEQMMR